MAIHGYHLQRGNDIRFQDLSDDEQDRVIDCLERGIAPETGDPRITEPVIRRWFADLALLKFWANLRRLRASGAS